MTVPVNPIDTGRPPLPLDVLLDFDEQWPQIGRGGFYRNKYGEVVVSHPDGGKRNRVYAGASSWWPWTGTYTGDPIYGERGTWVHSLCDIADGHGQLPGPYVEAGIELGIPLELQDHIRLSWLKFRDTHKIQVHAIEQTFVNDRARCASNCDRIVTVGNSKWAGGDIKTSGDIHKEQYAAQLALIPGSKMYDPETGERKDWTQPIDPTVAYIFWFPLNTAIKAEPGDWPEWSLVRVDLTTIVDRINTLTKIRDAGDYKPWFTTVKEKGVVEQWLRDRIVRLAAIPEAAAKLVALVPPECGNLKDGLNLEHEATLIKILDKLEDVHQQPFPERHPLAPVTGGKKKNK